MSPNPSIVLLIYCPAGQYPEACFEMVSCCCLVFDTPWLAAG